MTQTASMLSYVAALYDCALWIAIYHDRMLNCSSNNRDINSTLHRISFHTEHGGALVVRVTYVYMNGW